MALPVEGWDNFYVIIGSSAAALTGLMFVVIALMPTISRLPRDPNALDAFASPTVVHFGAVLLVGAFITVPRHTMGSLVVNLAIVGAAGVVYATIVILRTVRQRSYQPEFEDWLFHAILPVVAYVTLFISSFFLVRAPEAALDGVATSAMLLLTIGIHNAWDAALWMTTVNERMEENERAIREVMERWMVATKAGDVETVLSLMTEDVVFVTAGQTMDRHAFRHSFQSFAGKVRFEGRQDIKEVRATSDLAYAWSYLTITMNGKTRSGNILSVFRKVEGKWLLSRDANFVT